MIKLLDFHKKTADSFQRQSEISKLYYYIVLIGAGGNGGYAVQRITKMMNAFENVRSFLLIADPDTVEEKNLHRQPFIATDIGQKKADVLAKRYGGTYGLKIGSYSDSYIESVDQLEMLFSHTDYRHERGQFIQKVLIGAVDNDFSRKVMHDYFNKTDDLIYIDAGIEGVYLPPDKSPEEWTDEEAAEHRESGYSGQVVVGLKKCGRVILPPLDAVYPINAKDAIPPSHSCGVEPYQPQRMISNEMAAMLISTVVNELFSSNAILVHYVNFNAKTGNCRPVYAEDVVGANNDSASVAAAPYDQEADSGLQSSESGQLQHDPDNAVSPSTKVEEDAKILSAEELPAEQGGVEVEVPESGVAGVREKGIKVIRIETLDEKHEKTQHGYGVPVLYHLEDGSTLRKLITGTRLKDAKARVEKLIRDPGNRWIERTENGLVIEKTSIG
jgi:hypothetical protein